MKSRYLRPSVTHYDRDRVIALMGPVLTQYGPPPDVCSCQEVGVPPVWKQFNLEPLEVSVDVGGCTAFTRAEIALASNGSTVEMFPFSRGQGSLSDTQWAVMVPSINLADGSPGQVFEVRVTLFDGVKPGGTVCLEPGTIVIQGQ